VVASWGLTGLDAVTADRLYEKVKAQTSAGPQPDNLKMTYLSEWLEANVRVGAELVASPKVCTTQTCSQGEFTATSIVRNPPPGRGGTRTTP
jgi:hypothetical protein